MLISEAEKLWPDTKGQWRELANGAIAHANALVGDSAKVLGPTVFRGGVFHGGYFRGGVFHGGYFYDGVFHGGVFHGGYFRGGVFYDGVFRDTPFQLFGCLPWPANICGPSELRVGCCRYSIDHWRNHFDAIAEKHNVNAGTKERVRQVIEMAAASEQPKAEQAAQQQGGV